MRVADYLFEKDRLFARVTLDEAEYALAPVGLAGEVPALDLRELRGAADVLERALSARQVPHAERGGADRDRHLALARLGVGHFRQLESVDSIE